MLRHDADCFHRLWNRFHQLIALRLNIAALLFFMEFIRAPNYVGSICQSSPMLTKTLVELLPTNKEGIVVDLGAGTGVVTEQLIKHGYPVSRIIAVEKSPVLSREMRHKWPELHILTEDAVTALRHLRKNDTVPPVRAVISSLPLRVFPQETTVDIMRSVHDLLTNGGCLIQYSYALWMRYPLAKYGFQPAGSSIVLGNMPPARVERYQLPNYKYQPKAY